jgi:hypothetical protein
MILVQDRYGSKCGKLPHLPGNALETSYLKMTRLRSCAQKGTVMTVTLNLPPNIEQLYLAEAQSRGLALEEVIAQTLVAARKPSQTVNR